jgi:hypothetical protein
MLIHTHAGGYLVDDGSGKEVCFQVVLAQGKTRVNAARLEERRVCEVCV